MGGSEASTGEGLVKDWREGFGKNLRKYKEGKYRLGGNRKSITAYCKKGERRILLIILKDWNGL